MRRRIAGQRVSGRQREPLGGSLPGMSGIELCRRRVLSPLGDTSKNHSVGFLRRLTESRREEILRRPWCSAGEHRFPAFRRKGEVEQAVAAFGRRLELKAGLELSFA